MVGAFETTRFLSTFKWGMWQDFQYFCNNIHMLCTIGCCNIENISNIDIKKRNTGNIDISDIFCCEILHLKLRALFAEKH